MAKKSRKERKKLKEKNKQEAPNSPDYGTEELRHHHSVPKVWDADPEESGKPVLHRKNVTQTVLDRYFRNGFITNRQYRTGCRLRKQFRVAGLDSLVSIDIVRGGSGSPASGIPTTEAAAQARQSLRHAFESVGRSMTKVLVALVHDDRDVLSEISALNGGFKNEPQKRAALAGVIGIALETLADHYGEPLDDLA